MMNSEPSTPIGNSYRNTIGVTSTRQRQQQQQVQVQYYPDDNYDATTTTSASASYPYRDDPSAPASSRLESYTIGGYGPLHSTSYSIVSPQQSNIPTPVNASNGINNTNTNTNRYDSDEFKKKKSLSSKYFNSSIYKYCCSTSTSSTSNKSYCYHLCTIPGYTFFEKSREMDNNLLPITNGNPSSETETSSLYYLDDFNDLSFSCSVGTNDDNGVWLNQNDIAGTIMSCMVWVLILYSSITISFLAQTGGISCWSSYIYTILSSLALSCHVKTSLTDPGSVPISAVPTEQHRLLLSSNNGNTTNKLSMCSQCQTYKPIGSHHCRICNRCICKMDHHCPWMNNCIGAGNIKHFILFLCYTWICSTYCLVLLGYNYFFCNSSTCTFTVVLLQLVRLMTILCFGSFLFTSSMIMNIIYGIMTGVGTIDRLKKKASGTTNDSDEDSIPLYYIFGINPLWTWFLPIDPTFHNYDTVMGYSTPQRYLREQIRYNNNNNNN